MQTDMTKKSEKDATLNTSAMLNVDLIEDQFELPEAKKLELENLYKNTAEAFTVGKIITGTVVSKDDDGVLVDIQYKSNGLINNHEFSNFELAEVVPGSDLDVVIDRLEDEHGTVVLSYQKAKSIKAWDKISALADDDEPVRGIVTHKVKGGLSVDIGIPAFLPGSQVDIQRVMDFDQFVGQEIISKILKINQKRGNVIISRRKYIEEQRMEEKKHALETISEGQTVQGTVKNITNYGAFVDIGGIDGLLHITDMSWGRITHPSELVKIGDTVAVKVLSFDKDHEKISLGMKQLTDNPWEQIKDKFQPGARIKGKISSITDYGLFVEVAKGVEGLIHISEISWTERINNLNKHYKVGDEVEALVVALDTDNRRMSLSVKQISEDPWKAISNKFHEGDKIKGEISNITDFGLFVRLDEGIDGLVHISDLSWTSHITHPGDVYKKGDEVETVVLSIDEANRKISLGIKQLDQDPWDQVIEQHPVGSTIKGTISKITKFSAFVKLPSGIEGLVHISELSNKEVGKVEDILSVGQEVELKVIKVNRDERKLGLSLRAVTEPDITPTRPTQRRAPRPRREGGAPKRREEGPKSHSGGTLQSSLQQALAEHAAKTTTEAQEQAPVTKEEPTPQAAADEDDKKES